jgi:hypothetical protein
MKRTTTISKLLAMHLAISGLALLPVMAAGAEAQLATMTPAGASVMWETQSSAPQMELSVTGPGVAIRQVRNGGAGLSLSLTRADGTSLPDGTYNWEIRESCAGLNDGVYDPANGRDAADAASTQARIHVEGRVQSGVFSIKNGFLVDSSLKEETAQETAASAEKESQ